MTTDGIKVVHGSLAQAAQDMQASVKAIDDRLNRLESELAPLKNDWTGSAQQSYHVAKGKWDAAIAEMAQLLKDTSLSVEQSNADYKAADARGAANFGG